MSLTLPRLFLLLLCIVSTSIFANSTMTLDRNPVQVDETFTLEIKSDDTDASAPQFKLPDGIDQLQRNNISSRSIVNGKISAEQRWVYKLVARKLGDFTFPAVQVGNEKTNALTLTVNKKVVTDSGTRATKLLLRADLDQKDVFVQQQVMLSIKLFRAVPVRFAQITEPAPANALIQQIGDDVEYETEENGQAYFVLERRYALFPQKAGPLDIAPVQFNGDITVGTSNSLFGAIADTEPVSLQTAPLHVQVNEAPVTSNWLPAQQVELSAQVLPPNRRVQAGEPVTLNLNLHVVGQIAANVAPLNFADKEGVHYYPDQVKDAVSFGAKGIELTRTQKIAVVPTQSGTLQLAPIEIPWFNTVSGQQEIARVNIDPITVVASDNKINPIVATPEPEKAITPTAVSPTTSVTATNNYWPWIAVAIFSLWLLTLLGWWISHRRLSSAKSASMTPAINVAVSADREAVAQACARNDAHDARHLLLLWARQLTQQNDLNWAQLIQRSGDAQALLRELEAALYAAQPQPWQGAALSAKLDDLARAWQHTVTTTTSDQQLNP